MPYKVLIIGAHHEEVEAELPNTAAALSLAGCRVHILNPIGGWNWSFIRDLEGDGRQRTVQDATNAAKALGCEKTIWDYPVAKCDRFRDEIMDRMAEFLLDFQPDIVIIHWPEDFHADHRLVAHVSRHVILTAPDIAVRENVKYSVPKEVYAFQTGPYQAQRFIPDLLVAADDETMSMADRAVEAFTPTASGCVSEWKRNFHTKADYWGNLTGKPAEALKFLGPELPLDGFLLRKILGERLVPAPLETFFGRSAFQL